MLLKITSLMNLLGINNFTYEFAWYMCNLGNAKRGKIFSQLNKIVFRKIENNYPQLINTNLVENRLHSLIMQEFKPGISKRGKIFSQLNKIVFRKIENNYPQLINTNLVENRLHSLIMQEFKPGISYTQEHLELFINSLEIVMPGLKLSIKTLGSIIKDNYVVEEKQTRSVNQLDNYFYKNIVPNPLTGKIIKINTIKDFRTINDIVFENNLPEISLKSIENIIENRYKAIIESKEAREILEINKIFSSK